MNDRNTQAKLELNKIDEPSKMISKEINRPSNMFSKEILDKILQCFSEADFVLVGMGEGFSAFSCPGNASDTKDLREKAKAYLKISGEDAALAPYRNLEKLLHSHLYFINTLNIDGLIYKSPLLAGQITAPCGNMLKLQCREHILDANAALLQEGAVCPQCGRPLGFHIYSNPDYLEQGYLEQWEKYNRFLTFTMNRKLVLLELGVGFSFPQVIRFPFERIALLNQKATLIRVDSRLPQTPAELDERGIPVKAEPAAFLERMLEASV